MSPSVGTWTLTVAVLLAAGSALASVGAARLGRPDLLGWARRGIVAVFVLFTVAMWALGTALVQSNFAVAYVASYSERALPMGYKIAALWAGQEGSILLWAWLIGLAGVVYLANTRRQTGAHPAAAIAALSIVLAFFAALMVIAADPFVVTAQVPVDGHGLNPLLQHPSMVAHPPLLFAGYAGLTIPFVILIGALADGRSGDGWVVGVRRWVLVSWALLTVGILLGAEWAYVELGWGGYWAWDPVENASLLPWLTATALAHSIGSQRRFGLFRRFNAGLIVASFMLCILATYLTRSGAIQSVHAFGESLVGTFFLVFLIAGTLGSIAFVVARRRALAATAPMPPLTSRPGMFFLGNCLLVVITAVVAVGTMFPLISGPFVAEPISVGPMFYNKAVLPLALVLCGLMAMGPLLRVGDSAPAELRRRLPIPLGVGALAVVAALIAGLTSIWALACTLVVATAAGALVTNFVRLVRQRQSIEPESFATAALRLIDNDHRRFGGQFVHIGMFMLVVGTAGSSLFKAEATMQLRPGQQEQFDRYTVAYDGMEVQEGGNYIAFQANVTVTDRVAGESFKLAPQQRDYAKSPQMHAEVALRSTLTRDVYVTLVGWEGRGQLVALNCLTNPLIAWIWIGGLVMTLGALFCMFPPLLPKPRPADAPAGASPARVIHLAEPTCNDTMATATEMPQ